MATSTSDITGNSALAVRGNSVLTTGLISAAVAGSILLAGGTHTDRGAVSTVNNYFGTGAFLSYIDATCTNTGGLSNARTCYVANPITGTAAIMRLQVDFNKAPVATPVTCVTTPIGNVFGTGQVLIKYAATASGTTVSNTGSVLFNQNTNGTAMVILPGAGVRCWTSPTAGANKFPGVGIKAQMRLWYNAQYVP